jgi:2-polyprenyl-6-methoxyphenol hydroxylase-like FAD-dependent oxidoreductase
MSQGDFSIAIVGAGIGGLAAAALLLKEGFRVAVYEQATGFARVGAGIQQSPNVMKVHRGLGIEKHLREIAFNPRTSLNRDGLTGATTNEFPLGDDADKRYGAPFLAMHRADLHEALAGLVPAEHIKLGRKLASIDQNGAGVTLTFNDGARVDADAVIGADGVHSLIREYASGPEQPRFTGRIAYRTTFPASLLRGVDPGLSRTKWWGPDRHIVIYFTTAKRDEVYFVTSTPEKADWITRESWSTRGDLGELREAFKTFHPDVRGVLDAAPEVHKWGIFERDPLAQWTKGRVTLLGDACHPMTPYMASGAAMALEDAVILARCMKGVDRDSVENALRLYEATRKPRTSMVQVGSSANTWMRGATNPDWLYGYDAWEAPLGAPEPVEA